MLILLAKSAHELSVPLLAALNCGSAFDVTGAVVLLPQADSRAADAAAMQVMLFIRLSPWFF
jgi:hypothetical protein